MTTRFDAEKVTKEIIQWIRDYFSNQPSAKGAVIGISGGKDSTVVAKLLVEALGRNRVMCLLMPNGEQSDIADSYKALDAIGVMDEDYMKINISQAYDGIMHGVEYYNDGLMLSDQAKVNIAPRLRMTALYAVAQTLGYRVAGTGNKCEAFVGYCTKWGDMGHDFNPIADLTVEQVMAVGDYLGLPHELVHKTPSDGLCGKSDEDNLGFTYNQVAEYIDTGKLDDEESQEKIELAHTYARHKFERIPYYKQGIIR